MTRPEHVPSHLTTRELVAIQRATGEDAGGTRSWTQHVLAIQRGTTVPGAILITAALLALAWTGGLAVGPNTEAALHHTFWLPIAWAAFRLGLPGAVASGLAAAILTGPLLPAAEPASAALLRGAAFVAIGVMVAAAATRLVVLLAREDEVAAREHELDLRRAALIRAVSHEFRTPLTVIRGTPDLLARDGLDPHYRTQLLDRLATAGRRLERLVETVLAVGDALGHNPASEQRQDMAEVRLDDLVTAVARRLEDTGRVRFEAVGDATVIRTVPSHLHTVLGNLVENALKFSPEGTPVDVTATRVGDTVQIVVRDHGPGISLATRRDAFEIFTQLDSATTRTHGGLGLGLFCARQVGRLLAAEVDVAGAPGGGTDAIVRLPQRRDEDVTLAA